MGARKLIGPLSSTPSLPYLDRSWYRAVFRGLFQFVTSVFLPRRQTPSDTQVWTARLRSGAKLRMRKHWLIGGLASLLALAGLAFIQEGPQEPPGSEDMVEAEYPSGQPIAFPHDQHAGSQPGQNNMDCQYCHYSAERSVSAGIPSVSACWGCHQAIPGSNNPEEVAKIQQYIQSGDPIPWVRIYKVADHVHFPHMRHLNAGLECQQCHGEVQELQVLDSRDPAWGGDNMGWCVECHRQPDDTGKAQASTDCTVCHY